jgi:hypothetical protein
LTKLWLENCDVEEADLENLTELDYLKITKTKMQALPACIGKLCNLRDLQILDNDKLKVVPETV